MEIQFLLGEVNKHRTLVDFRQYQGFNFIVYKFGFVIQLGKPHSDM